jgi:hypothetical protein
MHRTIGLILLALPLSAFGECPDRTFQVRRAFDGAYEEQRAARLHYRDSKADGSEYALDAALRYAVACNRKTGNGEPLDLSIGVVGEFHRNTGEQKPYWNNALGVTGHFMLGVAKSDPGLRFTRTYAPYLTYTAKYHHDELNDDYGASASVFTGLYSPISAFFGGLMKHADGSKRSRLLPTIGVEHLSDFNFGTADAPAEHDLTMAGIALSGYWRPFAHGAPESHRRLEFQINSRLRQRVGGFDQLGDYLPLHEASLNYYFDADEAISLGLSYENGHNATRGFRDDRITTLALQIKLDR